MSRFASLPLAVRVATAFGLQAIALIVVTVLALNALGTFRAESTTSPRRTCARSRSPARSASTSRRSVA